MLVFRKYLRAAFLTLVVLGGISVQAQPPSGYVYVDPVSKKFKLDGSDWYALSVNYKTDVVYNVLNGTFHLAPHNDYSKNYTPSTIPIDCDGDGAKESTTIFEGDDATSCELKILEDLLYIKNTLKMNSVRWVAADLAFGVKRIPSTPECTVTQLPALKGTNDCGWWNATFLDWGTEEHIQTVYDLIQTFLDLAETAGLKVEILIGEKRLDWPEWRHEYSLFLGKVANQFKDNTTLFAYDLYNEPEYFDKHRDPCDKKPSPYTKQEVCEMTSEWHQAIKHYAPHHLTTIGLTSSNTVFDWDPGVIPVDFTSFHSYYQPKPGGLNGVSDKLGPIKRQIFWYHQISNKPFVLGETGFSANHDNSLSNPWACGTQADQADFVDQSLDKVRDCNAAGYQYWMFADVEWEPHLGIVDNYTGAGKLAQWEFGAFDPTTNIQPCNQPSDYLSYCNGNTCNLTKSGSVSDFNGNPIPNAVIRVTGTNNKVYDAITDQAGNFTVKYGGIIGLIKKMKVTAPGHSIYSVSSAIPILWPSTTVLLYNYMGSNGSGNLTINNLTVAANQVFDKQIQYDISATNMTVEANGSSELIAGNRITLSPPFQAEVGSDFHAVIGPFMQDCFYFYYPQNQPENQTKRASREEEVSPQIDEDAGVVLYPNPTNGIFNVNADSQIESIKVYDYKGSLLMDEPQSEEMHAVLDLSGHLSGIYLIQVSTVKGSHTFKLVKQ